jgi:hypothetical protein
MSTDVNRIPVYFKPEHLPNAYRLALDLEGVKDTRPTTPESHNDVVVGDWTAADVRRAYLESPMGMRLIFDGMIDRADEVLDSADLASFLTHKANADAVTVRGTMGAFANRCGIRYGRKKKDFPFEHWYVEGGYARYRMPAAVADVLRPLKTGTP